MAMHSLPYRFEFVTTEDLSLVVVEEQHALLEKYAEIDIPSVIVGLGEKVAYLLSKVIANWSDNDRRKRHGVVDGYICSNPVRYNMNTFEPEVYLCRNSCNRKLDRHCKTTLVQPKRYPVRGVEHVVDA